MILKETDDYIIINKWCNVSSQGGRDTKANIPFLMNLYLHGDNQLKAGEDINKYRCYYQSIHGAKTG